MNITDHNDTAIKSKVPSEGQKALDNLIQVIDNTGKSKKSRIAIIENDFIVLYLTREDPKIGKIYHGFVTLWARLNQDIQNTLKRNNKVKEDGTIIKKQ